MGQEAFDEFYLREYPKVVGLLQGLLRSRLVAEELAQETFLVAYRDWGRVGGLDNPRAWVRRVALNQRGSFLRAYLRQQAREQRSVVREEHDTIKLADEHAEVWQAIRTLPASQAPVTALHYDEDFSISQIAAALDRAPGTIKAQLHQGRRRAAAGTADQAVVPLTAAAGPGRQPPAGRRPQCPPGQRGPRPAAPARLNRNQRDARLALALRDYSVASQACRREAAAP